MRFMVFGYRAGKAIEMTSTVLRFDNISAIVL
jgi:hypothetical protein